MSAKHYLAMLLAGVLLVAVLCLGGCSSPIGENIPVSGYAQTRNVLASSDDCVVGNRRFQRGAAIPASPEIFSVDIFLADYSPAAVAVLEEAQRAARLRARDVVYSDYSEPLFHAARERRVERFVGTTQLTVRLFGVPDTARVSDFAPYKTGWGRCAGMARVIRLGPHSLEVSFPISGGSGFGQGGVVFPRSVVRSPNLAVCSTAGVDTWFVPELIHGSLEGMENTLCTLQGHATERAMGQRGEGLLFSFIAKAGKRR